MKELAAIVRQVVLEVVQLGSAAVTSVGDGDTLTGELGLQSLDLAQIVATLEARTGLDPFAERVAITSVRTVGDLVAAYRSTRDALAAPGSAALEAAAPEDAGLAESASRAAARRRAKRARARA